SWFASTDDWDNQIEGFEYGWPAFFSILRLYLSHFRGLPCSPFQLMGVAPEPTPEAWAALTGPLGLSGATAGQRVSAPAGAPPLAVQGGAAPSGRAPPRGAVGTGGPERIPGAAPPTRRADNWHRPPLRP